ncbi:PAAR domain-containing protein [Pseudomonas sp. GD03842]|uniref:cytidine deaminase-like fold-containing protein n=1 Tax=Pseudomonas sp. GD03842 TaxID=2975385 RepID=UPI0024480D7C|nr:PAAR domain-containing protein [Pseudomonas sp. GD03842]
MVAGAVVGALIGAAVLAATAATGGLAIAIMGGVVAGGGLSTLQVVKGLGALFNWPEPTTGKLIRGSADVFINGRPAVRAGDDAAASCTGLALNHPLWPFQVTVAEGSATVFINGKPAARVGSKMVCGAHIKAGSENVFIGGATMSVAFVLDIEGWMKSGLEILGLASLGMAAVLAAMVGATTLAGMVVASAGAMGGMVLLGDLGDRLGPGYRDLLQGVAGMMLLGAGPKAANVAKPHVKQAVLYKRYVIRDLREEPVVFAEGWIREFTFRDVNQLARPSALADRNHLTLIAKLVEFKILKYSKPHPNGNMATAHAEVGVIQQAYEKGLTRGADMTMNVTGRNVCSFCKTDLVAMAKSAELKSLTIYELHDGYILRWEQGMGKFLRSKIE